MMKPGEFLRKNLGQTMMKPGDGYFIALSRYTCHPTAEFRSPLNP